MAARLGLHRVVVWAGLAGRPGVVSEGRFDFSVGHADAAVPDVDAGLGGHAAGHVLL